VSKDAKARASAAEDQLEKYQKMHSQAGDDQPKRWLDMSRSASSTSATSYM